MGFAWVGARKAFGSEGLDASVLVSVTIGPLVEAEGGVADALTH